MDKLINPEQQEWAGILARPQIKNNDLNKICKAVFAEVMKEGNKALAKYTWFFDKVKIENFKVSEEEFEKAAKRMNADLKEAIREAYQNISAFHALQKPQKIEYVNAGGVRCWQEARGIEKVGLYIPGGSAPLFSTVLMLAIPANLAGCREVILCTPPGSDGKIEPAILWTARLCGVKQVYKVGGIQAIAAMTFGTEDIPRVYKIFGPGNQYVTAAKQLAGNYGVAIDMPAGPSEVMVVADKSADPVFVAADLLSQAEHGPDSQVILVTPVPDLPELVEKELQKQLLTLPRKEIATKALNNSKSIILKDIDTCMELVNEYAPEHLILCVEDYSVRALQVMNAGSVFLGNYSPESAGDYASGTNHTLPTNGYAKTYSGVNIDSFCKKITFQEISKEGLGKLAPVIEIMAENEQLQAHRRAVELRIKGN